MKNNSLTITLVLETSSANFGEGFGNVSELKKITRGNGEVYTYISKQSIKKEMRTQMGLELTPVVYSSEKKDKNASESKDESDNKEKKSGVAQFSPESTIKDYAEIDLFGYMKTKGSQSADIRLSAVRVSDAISLEPFSYDMDFLTNGFMAQRAGGFPNLASIENHKSLYSYTVTIDLDRIGVTEDGDVISCDEKTKRVNALLEAIQYLYKDVRGDRKSFAPIFIVGGIYNKKSPFFIDAVAMSDNSIIIKNIIDIFENEYIKENTLTGIQVGRFDNGEEAANTMDAVSINKFFSILMDRVSDNYK